MHAHISHAVGWAQAGRDIPVYGTTHADYFYEPILCAWNLSRQEIGADYETNTGHMIMETFRTRGISPVHILAIICRNHWPFTRKKHAVQAMYHSVVLETVAKMAMFTEAFCPRVSSAPQRIQDKHFMRKHGPNAYYGQIEK